MNYEQFLCALCLWREARNSTKPIMAAIRSVIENRTRDPQHRWPKTVPGVILQHAQFSSFSPSDPNATRFPVPASTPDWTAWQACLDVMLVPLGADATNGANHYEDCEGQLPEWADPEKITVRIGKFRFYRL